MLTTNKHNFCQPNVTSHKQQRPALSALSAGRFHMECKQMQAAASSQPPHGVARFVAANFNQNPRNANNAH
ncbi:unnamed protein product [Ceratitis capitata]|uniref:(Mediterranean fruit fly) hypothetical protein n=1 Tax=Ceratitis capitata TaxID=7213 RepID=A0A811U253_CERCA|nr:unnamed protein product [Ceratitis capitata]